MNQWPLRNPRLSATSAADTSTSTSSQPQPPEPARPGSTSAHAATKSPDVTNPNTNQENPMSNDHDDLLDRLDQDFAPGWQPNPGDKICLVIEEISHRDGGWGLYPVISGTLSGTQGRTKDGLIDGRLAVHAVHGVLRNELEQRRPAIGDRIAVKYLGKQEGKKGGADYEGYKVAHDPRDGAAAWGAPTSTPPATEPATPPARSYVTPDGDEPF